MNEDYLWDKTSGDPEIERLENALRAFAYEETAAPAIETNVLPFEAKPARKNFQFKYAAAACVIFAALGFAFLIQLSSGETNVEKYAARVIEPENGDSAKTANRKPNDSLIDKPNAPTNEKRGAASIQKIANPRETTESKPGKIKAEVSVNNRRRDTKPPITRRAAPDAPLTDEERYAYKQLMLALSVTSSKLQIVKDKVQSADEKPVVKTTVKDGR